MRLLAALAAHRPPQPLGLPHAEAGERHRDLEHLVLEDDDAERLPQRLGERAGGRPAATKLGSSRSRWRCSMYGWTALPWIGPGRTSATWTVRSSRFSGPRAQQALHLRAALDLEVADRVGALDLGVDRRVVERDPREVDRLAAQARDLVDALLDRREHPEPEQVDLQEAGVGARVLVPLADLAALHRRGLHRDELDERPARDDHPARVLRDVARQARDLAREHGERAPARRAALRLGVGELPSSSATRFAACRR